ncbi:hypothetical protein MOUN0_O11672 [Monosporozyma unispora]
MTDSQTSFSMEEENLFSMSVPRSIPAENNKAKIIPQVLLSPVLDKNCKNDIQEMNHNATPEEWLFSLDETVAPSYTIDRRDKFTTTTNKSLDDTIISNEGNCHNYYNMAQQNYQLWLASF